MLKEITTKKGKGKRYITNEMDKNKKTKKTKESRKERKLTFS